MGFPDEIYQENADKLKQNFLSGEIQLFAPSFITHETANAVWIAVKQRRIQQTDAQEALKFLQNTQLKLYELNWTDVSQSLAIACQIDIAIYDAAYLFLCDKMGAELITADNKLFDKAKRRFKVTHIKDYLADFKNSILSLPGNFFVVFSMEFRDTIDFKGKFFLLILSVKSSLSKKTRIALFFNAT